MREKIIFVIGLLVGAIIASGAFLIYTKTIKTSCEVPTTKINDMTSPEIPIGENGQLPEKPNRENNNGENSKKSNKGSTTNSESNENQKNKTKEREE